MNTNEKLQQLSKEELVKLVEVLLNKIEDYQDNLQDIANTLSDIDCYCDDEVLDDFMELAKIRADFKSEE